MGNLELQATVKAANEIFLQKVCEKHEFMEVTMTSSEINKPSIWLQCKNCGKTKSKF